MEKARRSICMSIRRLGFHRDDSCRDPIFFSKTEGNRKFTVQLWRDGLWRISHGIMRQREDGTYFGCRETTYPTEFTDIPSFKAALEIERTRTDHK